MAWVRGQLRSEGSTDSWDMGICPVQVLLWWPTRKILKKPWFQIQPLELEGRCWGQINCINQLIKMKTEPTCEMSPLLISSLWHQHTKGIFNLWKFQLGNVILPSHWHFCDSVLECVLSLCTLWNDKPFLKVCVSYFLPTTIFQDRLPMPTAVLLVLNNKRH